MDVIWKACSGSMISREAATSGQLSLIHRGISDVKDVSNNLNILEIEQLASTLDVGGVKESLVVFRHLSAWIVRARQWPEFQLVFSCVFPCFSIFFHIFLSLSFLFFLFFFFLISQFVVNLGLCFHYCTIVNPESSVSLFPIFRANLVAFWLRPRSLLAIRNSKSS